MDHPLLAGRVQKRGITRLEIVSNDPGIRLLEAHYPTSLSEFLESNKNEHDDDHEAQLVFWNEIDGQFPQFSPLFYVQAIFVHICFYFIFVNLVHNYIKKNVFKVKFVVCLSINVILENNYIFECFKLKF